MNKDPEPKLTAISKEVDEELDRYLKDFIDYSERRINLDIAFTSATIEHVIKPVLMEYENKQKTIDVIIDILKFAIPVVFSLWITSLSLKVLFIADSMILVTVISLVGILLFTIYKRFQLTKRYILIQKKSYDSLKKSFEFGNSLRLKAFKESYKIKFDLKKSRIGVMMDEVERELKEKGFI